MSISQTTSHEVIFNSSHSFTHRILYHKVGPYLSSKSLLSLFPPPCYLYPTIITLMKALPLQYYKTPSWIPIQGLPTSHLIILHSSCETDTPNNHHAHTAPLLLHGQPFGSNPTKTYLLYTPQRSQPCHPVSPVILSSIKQLPLSYTCWAWAYLHAFVPSSPKMPHLQITASCPGQ